MLPSLIISALVVRSLGGNEMKLKMMQYMSTRDAGQAAAPFHHYESSTSCKPVLPVPSTFPPLYDVQEQSYHQKLWNLMVLSRSPLQSHSMFVFLSRLLAFQTRKGTIILTLCAHAKTALLGPFLELICFKEKLTSLNRTHLMNLRKLGKCSFKTW